MKNQKKIVEKFQLEELEHRYEMAWISEVVVGVDYEGVGVEVTIPID